jgi:hypothetical protein
MSPARHHRTADRPERGAAMISNYGGRSCIGFVLARHPRRGSFPQRRIHTRGSRGPARNSRVLGMPISQRGKRRPAIYQHHAVKVQS